MSRLPPDTIALHQVLVVGLLSFVIGMTTVLVFVGWLMWRFVEPDTPWHQWLHVAVSGLMISVFGGMALAAGTMWLLNRWHYRQGAYRCVYCGRALKGIGVPCDCRRIQAPGKS